MAVLLPLPDVARRLGGVHENTVRKLIARGELRVTRVGARVFVSDTELDAYIDRNTDDQFVS